VSLEPDRRDASVPPAHFPELILNHISTCVVTADDERRASFANKVALDLLRLPALLGRDVVEIFGGSAEIAAALADVPVGGEKRIDFFLNRPDGPAVEMGMTIVRARPDAPRGLAFAFLFRDLADLHQVEMEMRRVERLSVLGKMVSGLSHELRNPLTGLQFLAEALLNELPEDDPRYEYASRMPPLVARIEGLIQSCLQFSEPRPADKRIVSAGSLGEALRSPPAGRRRAWPTVEIRSALPAVDVDTGQIVECVLALIENALEATSDAARVSVCVRLDSTPGLLPGSPHVVRIDVTDQGPGVPLESLAMVCDPFYTTKAKGTGLGLAIAHTLIGRNGGRLLIQSTPGVGSIFSVVLPTL
jgi:signal transduction histidine kinase